VPEPYQVKQQHDVYSRLCLDQEGKPRFGGTYCWTLAEEWPFLKYDVAAQGDHHVWVDADSGEVLGAVCSSPEGLRVSGELPAKPYTLQGVRDGAVCTAFALVEDVRFPRGTKLHCGLTVQDNKHVYTTSTPFRGPIPAGAKAVDGVVGGAVVVAEGPYFGITGTLEAGVLRTDDGEDIRRPLPKVFVHDTAPQLYDQRFSVGMSVETASSCCIVREVLKPRGVGTVAVPDPFSEPPGPLIYMVQHIETGLVERVTKQMRAVVCRPLPWQRQSTVVVCTGGVLAGRDIAIGLDVAMCPPGALVGALMPAAGAFGYSVEIDGISLPASQVNPTPVVKRGQHYCVEVPDGKVLGLRTGGRLHEDIPYDTDAIAVVMDGPRHVKLGVFKGVQIGPTLTVTVDTLKWVQCTTTNNARPIGFVNVLATPVVPSRAPPLPPPPVESAVRKRPAVESSALAALAKRPALVRTRGLWQFESPLPGGSSSSDEVVHFCDTDNLSRLCEAVLLGGAGEFRGGVVSTRLVTKDGHPFVWTRRDGVNFPLFRWNPPDRLAAVLRHYEAVPRPDPPQKGQWAYLNNERDEWDLYQDEQADRLEAAFGATRCHDGAALGAHAHRAFGGGVMVDLESMTGDSYVVDLGAMKQRNTTTGYDRPVRHLEVEDTGNVAHARREAGRCVSCGGDPGEAMVVHDKCFCELEVCPKCAAAGDCTRCNRPICFLVHRRTGDEISTPKDLPTCELCCLPCPKVAAFPCLHTQADKDAAISWAGSLALKALDDDGVTVAAMEARDVHDKMEVGVLKHPDYMVCENCVKKCVKCPMCC
jgi:hypothetical protein